MIPDRIDQGIIKQLQSDLPLTSTPFATLAEQIGISEEEYLKRLNLMVQNGTMRRLAAVLRHRESGYVINAMLVWQQEEDTAASVGSQLAELEAISHLYLRATDEVWPYNMYAMVHARSEEELLATADKVRVLTSNKGIHMVRSVKEYKKVSMQYDF